MDKNFDINNKAVNFASKNPKVIDNPEMLASRALEIIENYKIQLFSFWIFLSLRDFFHSFSHGIRRASSLREGAFFAKRETLRLCQCLPLRGRWQRAALTEGVIP